jgi:hypothetical protein
MSTAKKKPKKRAERKVHYIDLSGFSDAEKMGALKVYKQLLQLRTFEK